MTEHPLPPEGLPPDFEQRYGFIHADHSGVDLARLRRHHQKVARELRRQTRRRRELEAQCEQLRDVVVELVVTWYGAADDRRLPGMLGAARASAFAAYLQRPVDGGEDNGDRG